MFYFFIKIIIYSLILFLIFHIFNKKEITILEIIILLFIFQNICFSLYKDYSIYITMITSLIIVLMYYVYKYIYNVIITNKVYNENKVLINRGIINFNELIKEKYSYESLINSLKKHGVDRPDLVDYCIKQGNDLIIFQKNSIKNYPISLIIDGEILKDNLLSINRSLEWINKKIIENNLELKSINYAYYKNKNIYFITS